MVRRALWIQRHRSTINGASQIPAKGAGTKTSKRQAGPHPFKGSRKALGFTASTNNLDPRNRLSSYRSNECAEINVPDIGEAPPSGVDFGESRRRSFVFLVRGRALGAGSRSRGSLQETLKESGEND